MSSVRVYGSLNRTSHFLQRTRKKHGNVYQYLVRLVGRTILISSNQWELFVFNELTNFSLLISCTFLILIGLYRLIVYLWETYRTPQCCVNNNKIGFQNKKIFIKIMLKFTPKNLKNRIRKTKKRVHGTSNDIIGWKISTSQLQCVLCM